MRTLQIYFSNRLLIVSAFWQTIEKDGSGFHYHADDALGSTLNFDVARRGKGIYYRRPTPLMDLYGFRSLYSLDHSLSARLISAYEFGVIQLSAQPNCFTFVQSRA